MKDYQAYLLDFDGTLFDTYVSLTYIYRYAFAKINYDCTPEQTAVFMNSTLLRQYAELIARTGAHVQKGQYVIIRANVSIEGFAAVVAEECYKAGAKRVVFDWQSAVIDRVSYHYASSEDLGHLLPQEIGFQEFSTESLPILIWLDADDPDGLVGVDAKKVAQVQSLRYAQRAKYIEARENKYQWCIAGVPSLKWAKKVFPNLDGDMTMLNSSSAKTLLAKVMVGESTSPKK